MVPVPEWCWSPTEEINSDMFFKSTLIPLTTRQNTKHFYMVYGDSDLVVNQVMKEWDVRSPGMTGYCNAVRS